MRKRKGLSTVARNERKERKRLCWAQGHGVCPAFMNTQGCTEESVLSENALVDAFHQESGLAQAVYLLHGANGGEAVPAACLTNRLE